MEQAGDHWAPTLNAVFQLIKSRPENIVDDTSIEKLLTHLENTVQDEEGRIALLKSETGVSEFLAAPPESLLSNAISGNFALRLGGMLGGCSQDICDLLIENGSLKNLFGYLASEKNGAIKNAAMRYSFYEGLQMLLGNAHGYGWIVSQGYIANAIHAFNDASFYVTKSAITFLAKLLISANQFDSSQNICGRSVILQMLLSEYSKCDQKRISCYADLISLILENEPDQGFEVLRQFGGIHAMLTSKPTKKNSALLQAVSDICCKIITTGRSLDCFGNIFDGMKNESIKKMELADFLLNVCVDIANLDIMHFISHITQIFCKDLLFPEVVPSCWNEVLIHLTIWSVLHSQNQDVTKASNWLKKKVQVAKEYPFPEDALNLLGKLEKIIAHKTIDTAIWRNFFSTFLDNSKALFDEELQKNASSDTKQLTERLSLFLCDVMLIGVDVNQRTSSDVKKISISTSQARRSFTGKCIGTQILLVSYGWFNDFTMNAKLELCKCVVTLLKDATLHAQTLTSCIQLFSSLIAVLTEEVASIIFRINASSINNPTLPVDEEVRCLSQKLVSAFENLIIDSRWEVQDSLLDTVVKMVDKTEDFDTLKAFLVHHTFWKTAWQLLDADESYIRASSVRVIGIILEKDELREIFVQDFSLETVLSKLLNTLKHDDEAFPKRNVMDVVFRWLDICKVTGMLFSKNGSETETLSAYGEKFEEKLCQMILKSLIIAAEDFDWEVKLKGIQCWHKIIKTMSNSVERNEEELDTEERKVVTNDAGIVQSKELEGNNFVNEEAELNIDKVCTSPNFEETVSTKDPNRSPKEGWIKFLCKTGGSKILFNAINDCDQLVREATLKTLRCIRKEINLSPNTHLRPASKITSCYDLEILVAEINFSEEKDLVDMLLQIDFDSLAESMKLADDHVANHSISLLKDIIAAAQHSDDNLLDCY